MVHSADGTKRYKGGLHIHTDKSDGRKSPGEAAELYRAKGYDFIAITDHWVFSPGEERDGFTILSGIEYDIGSNIREGIFHIVGIGCAKDPCLTRDRLTMTGSIQKTQYVIDAVNDAGGAAVLAHPAWSVNRTADIMKLKGLAGIEIYNAVSGFPWGNRANSSVILDMMAADGFVCPVHAADDTHYYQSEQGSAFIVARAKSMSSRDLTKAIQSGDLYASCGPLLEIERKNDTLYVTCSPVSMILFQTGMVWIPDRVLKGNAVCRAEYTIRPSDIFVRVEAVDFNGKTAWSGYYT